MSIEKIQGFSAYESSKIDLLKKANAQTVHKFNAKDTYQSSSTEKADDERSELLANVRKRIKSGYYNSNDVIDDLGESFAKVLDKLL
jgi:hypothetical protein